MGTNIQAGISPQGTGKALTNLKLFHTATAACAQSSESTRRQMRKIEVQEWWLWSSTICITLLLTAGIVSFLVPLWHSSAEPYSVDLKQTARGLAGAVLLFNLYTIYQQLQIHRVRRQFTQREELFRLISENVADMI